METKKQEKHWGNIHDVQICGVRAHLVRHKYNQRPAEGANKTAEVSFIFLKNKMQTPDSNGSKRCLKGRTLNCPMRLSALSE